MTVKQFDSNMRDRIMRKNMKGDQSGTNEIHSSFVDIDYEIGEGNKPFRLSIEQVLVLDVYEHEGVYTEAEIEYQLEQSSYYRHVVFQAYLDQRRYRLMLEREFKKWYAGSSATAEKMIIKEKGDAGFSMSALANMLSSAKLRDWILTNDELGDVCLKKEEKLAEALADEDALRELADIIKERSRILGGILKRKREGDL